MSEPSPKRRRTQSPDGRASSLIRQLPRRPSFASPIKTSLARNYPNLLPSASTPRLSESPRRPLRRVESARRGETSEDSSLPATPSRQAFNKPNQPPRGFLFSSPSRRPVRAKSASKQSPLKPKAPAVQSDDVTRTVEDGPVEDDTRGPIERQAPDPELERRKQEKARLQREVEELESQISRCADEIDKEQQRGPNEALQPQDRDSLRNFIAEISGIDTEPEKPTVSSLLCSFLPFAAMPILPPRSKQPDRAVPSHRPVEVEDPLPYLEMFTSFKFSSRISLSRSKTTSASRPVHQKHVIDITGPQKLLTAQLSLNLDTEATAVSDLKLLRITPWAEPELGSFIRARAKEKDLSNAAWAIDSYWNIAQKRAQYWHNCETAFSHLLSDGTGNDVENKPQPPTKPTKTISRKDLNRHLGRDTLVLQDKHVLLKLNWRISFDWTGEAESEVTVESAFPRVWSETDTAASLKKIPETFASLLRTKGAFEATRIMVALLFVAVSLDSKSCSPVEWNHKSYNPHLSHLPSFLAAALRHILLDNSILLSRSLTKNLAPDPNLIAPRTNRALKIRTHAHTQLQPLLLPAQILRHLVSRLPQCLKILILIFLSHSLTPRNSSNRHEARKLQMRTLLYDMLTQFQCILWLNTALTLLARGIDLHQDS
ncbi:hypothetical protein yc1106_01196 [Curvularia clavata]|uniref:Uncharacterized protein n=1 Tax=Curvularia clavata TaxID=95742 RepID=A0A9Q8Z1C4_CURCL|nr:hypothetical protein yc1106_01196 [Curvularia clavata]